jgi:hypothetical protein
VYYLRGCILNLEELYHSAIQTCHHVLILSSHSQNTYSMDADSIMGYKLIKIAFERVKVTMELADETYVRFVGKHPRGTGSNTIYPLWDCYRSGNILCSSFLDSVLCQFFYYGDISDFVMKILGITTVSKRLKSCKENFKIRCIELPDKYFGASGKRERRYGEIFNDLTSLVPPVIPLGIYATHFEESPDGLSCCNPLPSAILKKGDRIMVIGDALGTGIETGRKKSKSFIEEKPRERSLSEFMNMDFSDFM